MSVTVDRGVAFTKKRLARQLAWPALFVLLFAASSEAEGRQILVLQSLDRGNLALDYLTGNFRVEVDKLAGEAVRFVQFVVSPSGFDVTPDQAIVDFVRSTYTERPKPDLVVTIGGPAAAFARKHRHLLFPEVPLLFAGVDHRFLRGAPLAQDETAVAVANDYTANIDDILLLLPQTTSVFVVMGSGEIGRFWRAELERDFERFRNRLTFTWSNQMTYEEILRRVSALTPNSAIFYVNFGADGQGGAYSEERVLADIHAAASAPLFGVQSPQFGHGIVGGRLMPIDTLGQTAAAVAIRILNGTSPGSIRTPIQQIGRPTFDWRELRRWQISESRLPPNSLIQFRQPGLWERFKWLVVAGTLALVAQTLLITALLASRVTQRRAEQSLRESEGRFRVLANSAPVMLRLSGTDMRSTDFNTPWLAFTGRTLELELGDGWLAGAHPNDVVSWTETYQQALKRREPFRMEYRLRRADGDYRWLLETSEPRLTPDGSFIGYVSSAIDITELKAARATLSNLNRRLIEAQEQERTRLARELHDDISQRVTLLAIELEQLRDTIPDTASDAREQIGALNSSVTAIGKDLQAISHRLHSSKLEFLGVATAAGSFCKELSAQRGVTIDYVHENVPSQLPEGVALNVFRVLQEALTNATKHSGARHYRVALRRVSDELTLEVADDGQGFDVGAALRGHGLGLVSMQERLKLINGEVHIDSKPGAGTTVRVSVPLQPAVTV
jgi:PAS domain S-box-containing protein